MTYDLDLNTYFYHKVKVKGQDLDHYPAKLLKHYRFVQNVFTFFLASPGFNRLVWLCMFYGLKHDISDGEIHL